MTDTATGTATGATAGDALTAEEALRLIENYVCDRHEEARVGSKAEAALWGVWGEIDALRARIAPAPSPPDAGAVVYEARRIVNYMHGAERIGHQSLAMPRIPLCDLRDALRDYDAARAATPIPPPAHAATCPKGTRAPAPGHPDAPRAYKSPFHAEGLPEGVADRLMRGADAENAREDVLVIARDVEKRGRAFLGQHAGTAPYWQGWRDAAGVIGDKIAAIATADTPLAVQDTPRAAERAGEAQDTAAPCTDTHRGDGDEPDTFGLPAMAAMGGCPLGRTPPVPLAMLPLADLLTLIDDWYSTDPRESREEFVARWLAAFGQGGEGAGVSSLLARCAAIGAAIGGAKREGE